MTTGRINQVTSVASPPRLGRSRGPGRQGSAHGLCHEEHGRGAPRERTRFGLLPTHTCGNPCSKRVAQWIADVLQKKANCLTERFPMAMNTASGILLPRRPDDRAEARSGSRTTLRRCSTRHGKPHETNERERTKQLCAEEEKKNLNLPPHTNYAPEKNFRWRERSAWPRPQEPVRRAGNPAAREPSWVCRSRDPGAEPRASPGWTGKACAGGAVPVGKLGGGAGGRALGGAARTLLARGGAQTSTRARPRFACDVV